MFSKRLRFSCCLLSFAFTCSVSAQVIDTRPVPINIALDAEADTNGSLWSADWFADILTNGSRTDVIHGDGAGGVTGFPEEPGFSYTIDLGESVAMDGITIFPRVGCCPDRLRDFRVSLFADNNGAMGNEVWAVDLFPDEEAMDPVALTAADGAGDFEGRFVVVTTNQDPVDDYELQLAEIEVYLGSDGEEEPVNYALGADAFTNGTIYSAGWPPSVLTDGAPNIIHGDGPGGTAGFAEDEGFYYEIDLGQTIELAEVHILPRQDGCCPERMTNYLVTVHDDDNGEAGEVLWSGVFRDDMSFPDTFDPDIVTADTDPAGTFTGQWVRVTSLATQDEVDDGLVDYRLQMSEIEVYGHKPSGLIGDFDNSGVLDAADIDILSEAVRDGSTNAKFDLDNSGVVDQGDRQVWVSDLRRTWFGDSNLDDEFNSGDFVEVFVAGQYQDGVPNNSTWATGDWDGSGDFDSSDFVVAFTDGGYDQGPKMAAAAVPEPHAIAMALFGLMAAVAYNRRRHA